MRAFAGPPPEPGKVLSKGFPALHCRVTAARQTGPMQPPMSASVPVPWSEIDTVLVDMDGTLLDLNYDNVFWNQLLPGRYAARAALAPRVAAQHIAAFISRNQHQLPYYCIDAWSRFIGTDLLPWKRELAHLIAWRVDASGFMTSVRASGRRLILATNAHPAVLALKHEHLGLCEHVDAAVTSHELGAPKEDAAFWHTLQHRVAYEPARSLFIDDNDRVLDAAATAGIAHLRSVSTPDSGAPPRRSRYPTIDRFDELSPPR